MSSFSELANWDGKLSNSVRRPQSLAIANTSSSERPTSPAGNPPNEHLSAVVPLPSDKPLPDMSLNKESSTSPQMSSDLHVASPPIPPQGPSSIIDAAGVHESDPTSTQSRHFSADPSYPSRADVSRDPHEKRATTYPPASSTPSMRQDLALNSSEPVTIQRQSPPPSISSVVTRPEADTPEDDAGDQPPSPLEVLNDTTSLPSHPTPGVSDAGASEADVTEMLAMEPPPSVSPPSPQSATPPRRAATPLFLFSSSPPSPLTALNPEPTSPAISISSDTEEEEALEAPISISSNSPPPPPPARLRRLVRRRQILPYILVPSLSKSRKAQYKPLRDRSVPNVADNALAFSMVHALQSAFSSNANGSAFASSSRRKRTRVESDSNDGPSARKKPRMSKARPESSTSAPVRISNQKALPSEDHETLLDFGKPRRPSPLAILAATRHLRARSARPLADVTWFSSKMIPRTPVPVTAAAAGHADEPSRLHPPAGKPTVDHPIGSARNIEPHESEEREGTMPYDAPDTTLGLTRPLSPAPQALLDLGPYAFNPRRHPDGPMLSDGVFEREESELSVHMGGLHADVSFGVGLLDIDGEYEVDTDMNAGAPMWAFGADQVDVGGGTIDPSMLGGLPPPTTAPDEDLSPMHTPPYRHHSLSPTGSSSPDVPLGPMIKKSKSVATVVESPSLARPKKKKLVREEEESIAGPSSGPGSYLDYDKEVLGLHLDNTDDEDFQPRTSSRPKKSTEKVRLMRGSPSLPVADRSSSPVRKKPKAKKVRDELDLSQRPLTTEESYCHQCRNKTYRPKMDCGECPKLFCDRCIDMRYPDITFNEHAIRCPACLNICNCTACSRRRGEEYVSMRGDGWRQRWGPASVQRGAPSQDPTTQISAASIPLPLNDGVYFGAVFSIDGRRMGTAYAAGGDRVVIASSTPAPGGGQDGAGVGDNAGGGPHTVEATQTGTSPTAERGQTGLSTEELETDVPPPVEVTSVAEAGTLALASGAVKMVRRRNKTVAHHFVGKKQKGWGSCSLLRDGIKTFGNKTKATPKIRLYIGDTPPRKLKIAPASPYTFADPPSPSSSELTPIDDDDDGVWPGEVPMEDVFMGVVKPPLDFVGEPDMNGGGAFAVDAISGQTVQKFTAEDLDKVLLAVQSVH